MDTNLTPEQAIERLVELKFNVTLNDKYILLIMSDGGCFNIPYSKIKNINESDPCIRFDCEPYAISLYKISKTFHITNYWD